MEAPDVLIYPQSTTILPWALLGSHNVIQLRKSTQSNTNMTSGGLSENSSMNCVSGASPLHDNYSADLDSSVNSEVSNESIPLLEVTPVILDDIKTPDISLSYLDLNPSSRKENTGTKNISTVETLPKPVIPTNRSMKSYLAMVNSILWIIMIEIVLKHMYFRKAKFSLMKNWKCNPFDLVRKIEQNERKNR